MNLILTSFVESLLTTTSQPLRTMRTVLTLVVVLVCSSPVRPGFLEEDQDVLIPDDWSRVGPVGPSEQLELTFALRQQGVDLLGETLRRVSDPDSPQYAKYLRLEEVSSLVRPSDLTQKVVRRWLQSHGVSACLSVLTRDFLQCTMPAQPVR
ncbi:unnamed protein product [Arctogadus glacialis]